MSKSLSDPIMEFTNAYTNAPKGDDPIMEFSKRQKSKPVSDDPIMDYAIQQEVESFREYGERGLKEFDKKIEDLENRDTNLLAADWMRANWRDIKAIPKVVAGGAAKGGANLLDTAAWFSDRFVEMRQPQKIVKIARQKNLRNKIESGERTIDSLTEDEKDLLEWNRGGMSPVIQEKLTTPVQKFGQRLIDKADMNPIGKAYFSTVGEMLPNFVPMSIAVKGLGAVKGLALYNALQAMPQGDMKQVALQAVKGAAMGKISQLAEGIKPLFLRALAEGTGDMSISAIEEGIRTGKINIDNQQFADMLTGFAMSYGLGKRGDVKAQEAQPDLEIRYEGIPRTRSEKTESVSPDTVVYPPQDTVVYPSQDTITHPPQDTVIYPADQTARGRGRGEPPVSDPIMDFANRKKTVSQGPSDPIMEYADRGALKQEGLQESLYEFRPDDSMILKPPPGETAPGVLPGEKISKYRTNTMEKTLSDEALQEAPIENYRYEPESLKEWESEAQKRVSTDFEGEMNKLLQKPALEGGVDGAIIDEINRRLDSQGRYKELAEFTEAVTSKIRETARGLRSIGIRNQFAPEKILRTAQGSLIEAVEKGGKNFEKQLKRHLEGREFLDEDFTRQLIEKAKQIEKMPEGRAKDKAQAEALKMIEERLPASILRKISSIQVIHQLLNAKTALRNWLGNTGFAVLDSVSQNIAGVPTDLVLSRFTGRRSIAFTSGKELNEYKSGYKEGWIEGFDDIRAGIDTSGIKLRRRIGEEGVEILKAKGESAGNVLSPYEVSIGTFKNPFYKALEKATGVLIRVPDRAAYEATFRSSVENQMRAAKVDAPTPEMLADAHIDGLYRTFQDTTKLSEFAQKFKRLLNFGKEFGIGDIVLKYSKAPANLVARAFDYSPAGFLRGVYKVIDVIRNKGQGKYSQRDAALTTSRGLTGSTLLYGVGYGLYNLGIIMIPGEKRKEGDLERAAGVRNFSINFSALKRYIASGFNPDAAKRKQGDAFASVDWFEPIATSLTMGAAFSKQMKELPKDMPGSQRFLTGILLAMKSGMITATDKPLFQGTLRLFRSKNLTDGLFNVLKSAPASFIPTLAGQLRYVVDPAIRDTRDVNRDPLKEAWNIALNKIPGLSTFLPEKIDITGKPQTVLQSGDKALDILSSFASPAIVSQYDESPGMQMVREVFSQTGDTRVIPKNVTSTSTLTIRGEKVPLTVEQRNRYQKMVGQEVQGYLNRMARNSAFQKLSPDRKAHYIAKYINRIGNRILQKFKAEIAGGQR
jgi:hypothetical protein